MIATSTAPPATWRTTAALGLAVAGLAIATYMTVNHYTANATLACSVNRVVDCAAVTSSPESVVAGIPVAVLGLPFFASMAALTTPRAWRSRWPLVGRLRTGALIAGLLTVAYLVTVELGVIGKICEWCTAVHVITVALAVLVLPLDLRARSAPA
ncbi:vitamin K epoxide reductase family protein [Amycolatopsis sp. PS_44_ISF1]|uniref:vitamin K epoxide reductase family protein n=1 Tax=Amycolatopsis sp. PS_44_ISF1 TaxID=2974917 RepID=UPI0028DDE7EE|nr:vitamin K epoxide reductase family protein [Amycolatopsis sp. PS_44_ISF1]MDT8912020.1 vitamin K epoxide reductase family protein [Amycolatopsis sp. PS_44_ISF1]